MNDTTDRVSAPEIVSVSDIPIAEAVPFADKVGFPAYFIDSGVQEVTRLDFIFPAGLLHQDRPFLASTTNAMLQEGNYEATSEVIAKTMDYYGSFIELDIGKDFAYATLYSPNKYLEKTLPTFVDMLLKSNFPDNELEIYLNNARQRFAVNMEKVGFLATNKFNEMLFGDSHPYGQNAMHSNFDNLNKEIIESFYAKCYPIRNCRLVASGNITPDLEQLLHSQFPSPLNGSSQEKEEHKTPEMSKSGRKEFIDRPDSVQSAIKVGRRLFNKTHPDFFGMIVLNTILGGYFGSRLMTNIREEKGYTYGISSSINSMQYGGYLVISTEVGSDATSDTLNEIYFELKRLREETVPENELNLVVNYMLGAFLRSTDGPFNLADKFKALLEYDLDYEYYTQFINTLKTITSSDINELANKYLQEQDFQELVVGKS